MWRGWTLPPVRTAPPRAARARFAAGLAARCVIAALLATFVPSVARAAWPGGGLLLPTPSTGSRYAEIGADGAGGVFVVRRDVDGVGQRSLRLLHLGGDGNPAPGWPADGVVAASPVGEGGFDFVGPDGAGGAVLAWSEADTTWHGYAQRVSATGAVAPGWPARGALVTTMSLARSLVAAADGAGGLVCAWAGPYTGARGVFVQHLLGDATHAAGFPATGLPLTASLLGRIDFKWPSLVRDGTNGFWLSYSVYGPDSLTAPSEVRVGRLLPSGRPDLDQDPGGVLLPIPHAAVFSWWGEGAPVALAPDGAGGVHVAAFGVGGLRAFHLLDTPEIDPAWPGDGVLLQGGTPTPLPVYFPQQIWPLAAPDGSGGAYFAFADAAVVEDARGVRLLGDGSVAPGWEGGRSLGGAMMQDLVAGPGGLLASGFFATSCPHFSCTGAGTLCGFLPGGAVAPGWPDPNPLVPSLPGLVVGSGHPGTNAKLCEDGGGGAYALWTVVNGSDPTRTVLGRFAVAGPALGVAPASANGVRARYVPGAGVRVAYALPGAGAVTLDLYDVNGRRVARERLASGAGEVTLAGTRALPAGLWFVRLASGPRFAVAKVAVAR